MRDDLVPLCPMLSFPFVNPLPNMYAVCMKLVSGIVHIIQGELNRARVNCVIPVFEPALLPLIVMLSGIV